MYDENGEAFGFNYNGNDYYYVRNAQNDVVRIVDSANETVVSYQYDSWGKLLSCEDTSENDIVSFINPYTYRGYYYDSDTQLYYLSSRYYNPELCRFISADSVVSGTGGEILGYNMFAYCMNNPVNTSDSDGNWPKWAKTVAKVAGAVVAVVAVTAIVAVTAGVAAAAIGATAAMLLELTTGNIHGANLFAYCGNDPINDIDPNGYLSVKAAGYIIDGVLLAINIASSALALKASIKAIRIISKEFVRLTKKKIVNMLRPLLGTISKAVIGFAVPALQSVAAYAVDLFFDMSFGYAIALAIYKYVPASRRVLTR